MIKFDRLLAELVGSLDDGLCRSLTECLVRLSRRPYKRLCRYQLNAVSVCGRNTFGVAGSNTSGVVFTTKGHITVYMCSARRLTR